MKSLKKMMSTKNCSFQLKEVTEGEVVKAMTNMKNSKSLGPDKIQADLLKMTMNWTKKAIQTIVNLSIKERKFPEKWKTAKVVPILKPNEDILLPKSYRPVSILCPLSRLAEKLIVNQVVSYLEENELVHPSIHGYCK